MKVRIAPLVSDHLLAAYDFLQSSNPAAAREQLLRIFETIDRLQQFPFSGRKGRVGETRELVVPRTPFILAYAIDGQEIQVLAVLHGSQQWPESF